MHWVSSSGFAAVTVGVILSPKDWVRVVALSAGLLEVVVGIPLAIATGQELGRFSLFSLAPIISGVLLIYFLWPKLWEKVQEVSAS